MAVTVDATAIAPATSLSDAVETITNSDLTVGSSATALIAILVFNEIELIPVDITVTWDNDGTPQPMTLLATQYSANTNVEVKLYGLVNPTPGNLNLTASWTGPVPVVLSAQTYQGTYTTTESDAFQNSGTNEDSSGTVPSLTLTGGDVGNISVAVLGAIDGISTLTASGSSDIYPTQTFDPALGGFRAAAARAPSAASVEWDGDGVSTEWAMAGIDVVAGPIVGALASAEAVDTLSAAGTSMIRGEASDTLSATGVAGPTGLRLTEANDTISAGSGVRVTGDLVAAEQPDVSTNVIIVIDPVALQESTVPFTITGSFNFVPVFSYSDDGGSAVAFPTDAILPPLAADLWTFTQPGLSAGTHTVTVDDVGTGASATVTVRVIGGQAALVLTEASDTLNARAGLHLAGALVRTEAVDTIGASGVTTHLAQLALGEAVDTIVATGIAQVAGPPVGLLVEVEGADTLVAVLIAQAGPPGNSILTEVEASDTIAATTTVRIAATLTMAEASDTLRRPSVPPAQVGIASTYSKGVLPLITGGAAKFSQKTFDQLGSVMSHLLLMTPQSATEEPVQHFDGMKRLARHPWRPVAGQSGDQWVYWDAAAQVWLLEGTRPTTT